MTIRRRRRRASPVILGSRLCLNLLTSDNLNVKPFPFRSNIGAGSEADTMGRGLCTHRLIRCSISKCKSRTAGMGQDVEALPIISTTMSPHLLLIFQICLPETPVWGRCGDEESAANRRGLNIPIVRTVFVIEKRNFNTSVFTWSNPPAFMSFHPNGTSKIRVLYQLSHRFVDICFFDTVYIILLVNYKSATAPPGPAARETWQRFFYAGR